MLKLLVIADDFTGALDTGVQFSRQGIQTLVSTEAVVHYEEIPHEMEVLVLNTESRHLNFDTAYEKTKAILEEAQAAGIPYIYKKVDSALRGNISAEIKAMIDTHKQAVIPFLPAYPEMNRVLIDGHLYIDDVLVTESVFADDPYEPVIESSVIQRLKTEADIEAVLVQNDQLPNIGVAVFDAQTDEMLAKHGRQLKEKKLLGLTVGCAGFAKTLAYQLFPEGSKVQFQLEKPIVVICGSVNPITKKQIAYAQKRSPRISLSAKQLLDDTYWEKEVGRQEVSAYHELLKKESLVVFDTCSDQTTAELLTLSKELGLTAKECRFRIGEALGKLTKTLWSQQHKNTFLFTGGDTLYQTMRVLGVTGIKPLVELKPGVVLSVVEWNNKEMQVITKSGGFGSETLFEEIKQYETIKEELKC